MPAAGRLDSTIQRGLRSIERIAGGATLYHVVFGAGARRPVPAQVSFDDIEPDDGRRSSRLVWAGVILFHVLLISIPVLSLAPAPVEMPEPPEGMTVELVSSSNTASASAQLKPPPKIAGTPSLPVLVERQSPASGAGEASEPAKPAESAPPPLMEAAPAAAPAAIIKAAVVAAPPPQAGAAKSEEEVRWEGDILSRIGRKKRYPASAERKGIEDVVMMRLVLDRQGTLVRAELARSGGHAMLDTEVLELAKRASPYPRPPSSVAGETVALLVPVEFVISKRK